MIKISKTPFGKFIFQVFAKNGKSLVTSEPYTRKDSCQAGAVALKKLMPKVKTIVDTTVK